MFNIKLVVVGKLKEQFHKDACNEYLKRLSRYAKVSIFEVEDEKIKDNSSYKEDLMVLDKEGKRILKQVKENDYVILLDLHGVEESSEKFAKRLDMLIGGNSSNITFVIGGSLGLSQEVITRSNFRLKLSPMTFTHQMTRIIILEQIYRAFKINGNENYHK